MMQTLHDIENAIPKDAAWCDAPRIPDSVEQALRAYSEYQGVPHRLAWDGWRGMWAIQQRTRSYDFDGGSYALGWSTVYIHVDENLKPLPLDLRLIDCLVENYQGATLEEKKQTKAKEDEVKAIAKVKTHEDGVNQMEERIAEGLRERPKMQFSMYRGT